MAKAVDNFVSTKLPKEEEESIIKINKENTNKVEKKSQQQFDLMKRIGNKGEYL
jgi:hypothetical protein